MGSVRMGLSEVEGTHLHSMLSNRRFVPFRLTAALEYYEQLKDSCLATGSTAQERAARRAEEIQSLKEAMDLLEKGTQ